jgi:hypothetical protein
MDDLARERSALVRDLDGQHWLLDRAAWELAAADVTRFSGVLPDARDRHILSEAVDWISAEWRRLPNSGRRTITVDNSPVTIAWQTSGTGFKAVVVTTTVVNRWIRAALERELPSPVRVSLVTESGDLVAGEKLDAAGRPVSRHVGVRVAVDGSCRLR